MDADWLPTVKAINDIAGTAIQSVSTLRGAAESDDEQDEPWSVPGGSTAIPEETGPAVVCGRTEIVENILDRLDEKSPGGPLLLSGAGGMGKSTIAREVAMAVRADGRRAVWWVSAVNEESLSNGLVTVAREVGASAADQEAIRSRTVAGVGDVADRVWRLLEARRPGWLVVIDNADEPGLLGPLDGTGWVRRTERGLLLLTTRRGDEACWAASAELVRVGPLTVDAATDVLTELAPDAGDPAAARELAVRLGCLPLALRMAGMHLRGEFSTWQTFEDYHLALDSEGLAHVIAASRWSAQQAVITQTWELSLDALGRAGLPQARPLLWLLSCYAPGGRIPVELVTAPSQDGDQHPLAPLIDPDRALTSRDVEHACRAGLRGLASVGLVEQVDAAHLELHPFIAEVTGAVLDTDEHTEIDPGQVRSCAVGALQAAVGRLAMGDAEHWPRFHVLTSHVHHMLASTATHLRQPQRQTLLDILARCVSSYMWSRAEQRAEQIAANGLARGRALGCAGTAAYLQLRQVHGWSVREQGRPAEAEGSLREVLTAQLALAGGPSRADALRTRHDLAWTTGRLGRWSEAERELREVLRLRRERLRCRGWPDDDADVMHTRCMLCWCVGKQGRWADAERGYRTLLVDRTRALGPYHADTLDTLESLGKTLAWQHKWADAEVEFHTLWTGRTYKLGGEHPDTLLSRQLELYVMGYRAGLDRDRRGRKAARVLLEQVVADQRSVRGDDHPNTRDGMAFLAVLRGEYSADLPWTHDLPRPELDRAP